MYDDDFYGEPSKYDEMVDEFKAVLRQEVKEEFQAEMARLKEENDRLQDIKKNWNAKVAELEYMKTQLKREMETAKEDARRARLSELLIPYLKQAWAVESRWKYLREKCDKCDEHGYIHFISPQGHKVTETCDCRQQILEYFLKEAEIVQIENSRYSKDSIDVWFGYTSESGDSYKQVRRVYQGEDFEEISKCYGLVFLDKGDAQRYCDYLNKKVIEKATAKLKGS